MPLLVPFDDLCKYLAFRYFSAPPSPPSPLLPPLPAVMSRKKISTTIYVTPEQSERLRLLHERTKVPVAVYIREGIDLVLRQYGHLLPGQLSLAPEQPAAAPVAPLGTPPRTEEPKPAAIRQDRASAAVPTGVEPVPERAAGGKG
jgi:hypothetical protein